MADGITVTWKDRSGVNVSLCDGGARGTDRFIGPGDSGNSQLNFTVQQLPALRATAMSFAPRGNASQSFDLRVVRVCSTDQLAFYYTNIWPSTLAPQASLVVTLTAGSAQTSHFLHNAVLQSVSPSRSGVSVDFVLRFSGGIWTTT